MAHRLDRKRSKGDAKCREFDIYMNIKGLAACSSRNGSSEGVGDLAQLSDFWTGSDRGSGEQPMMWEAKGFRVGQVLNQKKGPGRMRYPFRAQPFFNPSRGGSHLGKVGGRREVLLLFPPLSRAFRLPRVLPSRYHNRNLISIVPGGLCDTPLRRDLVTVADPPGQGESRQSVSTEDIILPVGFAHALSSVGDRFREIPAWLGSSTAPRSSGALAIL